jgi:PKD repeat protein
LWEFGDGTQAGVQHPDHFYPDTGSYNVSLTINDGYVSVKGSQTGLVRMVISPQATFLAHDVCMGNANFFDDQSESILYQTTEVLQYASEVTGFSSQYTDGNWAATEALGAPDVFPDHEDNVHAWASLSAVQGLSFTKHSIRAQPTVFIFVTKQQAIGF